VWGRKNNKKYALGWKGQTYYALGWKGQTYPEAVDAKWPF
jgi:hypothetical protein